MMFSLWCHTWRTRRTALLIGMALATAATTHAQSVLLYDFETGIPNVSNGAGFGFAGTTVAWENSGIGATSGTGSLKVTAPVDNFSWGAVINVLADPANTAAFAVASANPALWNLEFDVTLDQSTMPDWTDFVNGALVLNSQNGGFDQAPEPWVFGGTDTWGVRHAVVPFADLENGSAVPHGGGWLELGFSINGDWGDVPGSMYLDNIRLTTLIPEPASFALLGISGLGLLCLRRRK